MQGSVVQSKAMVMATLDMYVGLLIELKLNFTTLIWIVN